LQVGHEQQVARLVETVVQSRVVDLQNLTASAELHAVACQRLRGTLRCRMRRCRHLTEHRASLDPIRPVLVNEYAQPMYMVRVLARHALLHDRATRSDVCLCTRKL
jgi:hypothetical protein